MYTITPYLLAGGDHSCRCNLGCFAKFNEEIILTAREWFFRHQTHVDALGELARLMEQNNKQFLDFYVIRGIKAQIDCRCDLNVSIGVPALFRLCSWNERDTWDQNMSYHDQAR